MNRSGASAIAALRDAADDDHGPLRLAAGCGNSLPLFTLRGMPSSPPHPFVACAEEVVQGVGGVRKGVEEVGHRLSPGLLPMQAPITQPVRDEIFSHIFVE